MTIPDQFANAARGWTALTLGRPGWREQFVLTRQGLLVAIGGYFGAVLFGILFQSLFIGVPNILELLASVGINALPLLGMIGSIVITVVALQIKRPAIDMLVPGVHAVTFLLLLGYIVSIFGAGLSTLLLGLLGFMLYRAGREILGLSPPLALAFMALTIVLLVALPTGLYMLMGPGGTS